MTRPDCPRLFEAEAHRDGRLTGVERTSFERHRATCAVCARETEALEALSAPLRDGADTPVVDELHERRERMRLLAAFERSRLVPEPRGAVRRWLPALAAALVAVAIAIVFVRSGSEPEATAPGAVIRARGATTWSRSVDEHAERVFLNEGTLEIRRPHGISAPRLIVILPDGELEDIGTTFTVTASGGRTTRVDVEEGRVVLRLRGRVPVTLERGGSFSVEKPAPSGSVAPPEPSLSASASATTAVTPKSPPRASVSSTAARSATSLPALADASASRDFRAAMAALDAGDNAGAASAFARFLAQHGRDGRAEDAAYLRVIALQRAGSAEAMQRAAREYLRRYPKGFRRAEVEALLGE